MSSIADTGYLGYLCIAHTQYCTYTQKISIASVSMDTAVSMRRPDATGRGPAAAACAICAACRAPTNGDTTTGNKQGVRLMTLFAGCMRTSPERALRTPPSFSMEGPALGDPHTPLPWLLPPPPPQREGGEAGLAAPLRVLESRVTWARAASIAVTRMPV